MKETQIEGLQQQVDAETNPIKKVKLLNEMALVLEDRDLAHAIRVVDEAVTIAKSLDETQNDAVEVIANSLFTRGQLSLETSNYELAISSIYQALPLITGSKDDLLNGRSFEVLAKANFALGNAPEGFEFSWQALGYYENLPNHRWQAGLYNLIGRQYMKMGQNEWAEKYFQQAFDQLEGMPKNKTHADIHLNWSMLDTKLENFERARHQVQEAIVIYRSFDAMEKLTKALVILGRIHEAEQDYDGALEHFNQALQNTEEFQFVYRKAWVLLAIGQVALEKHDNDQAFNSLHQGLELTEQLNMRREGYRINRLLARAYKQTGNFDRSLEHFENFYLLEKQIEKDQDVQRVRSLEIMHQVEQIRKSSKLFRHQSRALREQLDILRKTQESVSSVIITDPLTGILNRKHFLTILENDHLNIEHYGKVVSMIMLDIDQFKKVNQERGNLVADQILVDLAYRIRLEFRQQDLIWRISGEEFVVLLPNTECKHAQILAERLLAQVNEYAFEIGKQKIYITITMGIACTSANKEKSVDLLLEHASQAWSIAKKEGGNQVVTWHPLTR